MGFVPVVLPLVLMALAVTFGPLKRTLAADGPRSVLIAAIRWLPADHGEWGQAMLAEMDGVQGRWARWRFGLSCARAALVAAVIWGRPPPGRTVTLAGVFAAAGVGIFVAAPGLRVFAVAFTIGLSACVWLAAVRMRSTSRGAATAGMALRAGLLAGVAGCIVMTVYGVVRFPSTVTDPTHVFSIVLALALTGYVWLSLVPPRSAGSSSQISRSGLIGSTAVAVVFTVGQFAGAVLGYDLSGHSVAVVLFIFVATGLLAGRSSNDARAGIVAGMWAGLGGAVSLFIVAMTGAYTDRYATAQDAALAVDDNLGGLIVMLVLVPLAGVLLGAFGGVLATKVLSPRT